MPEYKIAVSAQALPEIQNDPAKQKALIQCAHPVTGFQHFLSYWWFLDQERQTPRTLNAQELWDGQQQVIDAIRLHKFLYELKARKLGFTTLGVAYDAWVLRFRGANERVHLFSRREDAANELLDAVKYGLTRLPQWMKLPAAVWKSNEVALVGGDEDIRRAKAYPADEETAVEATCTHGHVDEWQRMRNPQKVWQAIEPSMAGTCHIITTGLGPSNFGSKFWVMTMNGDTPFYPLFVKATARPDRTEKWVEAKRKSMPEADARQEYPMTWEDALFAGADLPMAGSKLERCGTLGSGLRPAEEGHEYTKNWDVGRHNDAAVCTVIDWTHEPPDVVHYRRLRNKSYPTIQMEMEEVHELYPGMTVIEDNAAGEAVRENLDIPDAELYGYKTTGSSKPRLIKKLEVALANADIGWIEDEVQQLHNELATYQIPDTNVIQDSVMSLGIGYDYWTNPNLRKRKKKGRARVIQI